MSDNFRIETDGTPIEYSEQKNKRRFFFKKINYITQKPEPDGEMKTVFLKSNVKNRSGLADKIPQGKMLECLMTIDALHKKGEVLTFNENLREYRRLCHFFNLPDNSQEIQYKKVP